MPGCPNGAEPTPAALGLQKVLDVAALTASLLTLFKSHSPTSIAGFTASLVDVNALCASNPDPPKELSALDFVGNLAYDLVTPFGSDIGITQYIYEWLKYQAFTQFCVCKAPVIDPLLNCFTVNSLTIPSGVGAIVPLPAVTIQPEVYSTWLTFPDGTQRYAFNVSKTAESPVLTGHNWDLEILGDNGQWFPQVANNAIPSAPGSDITFTLGAASAPIPNPSSFRIRTLGGGAQQLGQLHWCWRPLVVAPLPLPPDPSLPDLPVIPPPLCSTDDLCAIVQELARQLTRVAGQVSDIQAAITSTDQFVELGRQTITGEGEVTLALGTRGVSLELTELSDGAFTSALGRPRGLMRVGSVRWGDGIGYSAREFIDGDRFDRLRPQGALSLSFQLLPAAVAILKFLG
jgi:hypothetical protein